MKSDEEKHQENNLNLIEVLYWEEKYQENFKLENNDFDVLNFWESTKKIDISFSNLLANILWEWEVFESSWDTQNSINIRVLKNIKEINIENYDTNIKMWEITISDIYGIPRPHWKYILDWLYIKKLSFHDCILTDSVIIKNCVIEKLFIHNTSFWETRLDSTSINILNIYNSTVSESVFNWTTFPINNELYEYRYDNNKWRISDTQMKDNYRQLKHVMDKNWNHTEANNFFAKEMEYYGKTLDRNNFNKVIYLINKYSSDFWNNWIRATGWLLFFWSIPFILEKVFQPNFLLYRNLNPDNLLQNWKELVESILSNIMIIPNLLKTSNDISWSSIIYALIISYLIYSLVLCFKRMTKR